jgi:hypothetical protein
MLHFCFGRPLQPSSTTLMYVLLGVCIYYRLSIVALLLQPAAAGIQYIIEESVVWCVYIIEGRCLVFLLQPAAARIEHNIDVYVV